MLLNLIAIIIFNLLQTQISVFSTGSNVHVQLQQAKTLKGRHQALIGWRRSSVLLLKTVLGSSWLWMLVFLALQSQEEKPVLTHSPATF